jgi:hypothetical protein
MFRPAMDIREIAAPPSRYEDFLACPLGPFQHGDAPAAFTRLDGAH